MALRPLREDKATLRDDSMMHVYREILLNIDKCRHFFAPYGKKMIKMFGGKKKNMYLCHKYGLLCPHCIPLGTD